MVGALINSTFLLAICVSICLEALGKFFHPAELINHPMTVVIVGGGGLFVNIIGLAIFGSFAHGKDQNVSNNTCECNKMGSMVLQSKDTGSKKKVTSMSSEQMNMRAVFLHVLGDALSSVIVMISALVVWMTPHNEELHSNSDIAKCDITVKKNAWILYLDPAMSIGLVMIMIATTVPVFKQSSLILLQTVPSHIELDVIREKIKRTKGVQELRDLRIWQLSGDKLVATVHLRCECSSEYMPVASKIQEQLHASGIHSVTVECN